MKSVEFASFCQAVLIFGSLFPSISAESLASTSWRDNNRGPDEIDGLEESKVR